MIYTRARVAVGRGLNSRDTRGDGLSVSRSPALYPPWLVHAGTRTRSLLDDRGARLQGGVHVSTGSPAASDGHTPPGHRGEPAHAGQENECGRGGGWEKQARCRTKGGPPRTPRRPRTRLAATLVPGSWGIYCTCYTALYPRPSPPLSSTNLRASCSLPGSRRRPPTVSLETIGQVSRLAACPDRTHLCPFV